ncbi:MAG TPA: hypothetical protein VEA80_13485 [Vitreimonas sp.]|uniref:hypothetical protein n=1 Tax=Vitreimonas sp. TaxID=3069702 RepID=UPI002D22387E|nr:hypothetical protein [Vitreimonas sp.]HYD88482.1 hypothetical protein [Vitreimonas sp.]
MRRAVAACVFLSACATAAEVRPPAERVAGCWINRDAGAVTMRWLPAQDRPGVMTGSRIIYGQTGVSSSTRYTLEPSEAGASLCELGAEGAATRCWAVAQGEGGSLEGGRAFIDAHGDRLRITVIGDGPEQTIFQGRRDGCD